MLDRAFGVLHVDFEIGVRIGPLKLRYGALERQRPIVIVNGERVMGLQCSGQNERAKNAEGQYCGASPGMLSESHGFPPSRRLMAVNPIRGVGQMQARGGEV